MKVKELMTREVECCTPDTNLSTAAMMMWRCDCGVVPVKDGDGRVLGMITDRDICMAVATQHRLADDILVKEVMSGKVYTVRAGDDIEVAEERMRSERVRRLPVVNADGRLAGVLSISDLVQNVESGGDGGKVATHRLMTVLRSVCGQHEHHAQSSASA